MKKLVSVGAVIAFVRSPTGQKMMGKAKDAVNDPRNREKVAGFVEKLRQPKKPRG